MDTQKPFKKVGTHNGKFHADEVMATAILKELFDVEVVRTRDLKKLKELDIVYDVGGGEFDHHDVNKIYREDGTPYAACGLIWRRYGKEVLQYREPSLTDEDISSVVGYVDSVLIKGIDAMDNGIRTYEEKIRTMNISSIISGFNPPWYSEEQDDKAFNEAVGFASEVLENTLIHRLSVIKAKGKVVRAYENRVIPEVMVLDMFCPWMSVLKDVDRKKEVLFVVYPGREGYLLHTVKKQGGTFEARKDLPRAWAGKRDEELGEIVGIDDAIFCHPGRFIAGAKSYDSVMKMADMAVGEHPDGFIRKAALFFKRLLFGK